MRWSTPGKMRTPARPERDPWLADGCRIVALAALPLLLLRPLEDTPFVDDWAYAWSVEWLLMHGEIRVLEWSSNWNVAQVLWGALFCLPGGFSFGALRASTWVLGTTGLIALHRLLRATGVARREAWIGTAALGVNPLWVVLGLTFMTDVPFVAATLGGLWAGVRALALRSTGWLVLAVAFGTLGCGVRFVGVAFPVALALALLGDPWGRRPGRLLLALLPLALVGVLFLAEARLLVASVDVSLVPSAPQNRWARLSLVAPSLGRTLPMAIGFAASVIGVALLPLTAAGVSPLWRGRGMALLGCLGALWWGAARWGTSLAPPLFGEATWTLDELGATAPLIAGYGAPGTPAWAGLVTLLALGSAALWLDRAVEVLRRPGGGLLGWSLAGNLALILVLWLFYDRYGLVLIALAIPLYLAGGTRLRTRVATVTLALYGALSLAGVHDHLALSRALWGGVAWLRERGARADEIDGGYVVNGWLHYAHPADAPHDARGVPFVPDLTVSRGELRYQLALQQLPGWRVLARIPFERWLGHRGAILVLERAHLPAPSLPGPDREAE